MAKMEKMNKNYKEIAGVVRELGGVAFAREVLNKMVADGSKRTFNSVNATLAAMAGKGYMNKEKALFGEGENAKMLTKYTITEKAIAELDAPEEGDSADAE